MVPRCPSEKTHYKFIPAHFHFKITMAPADETTLLEGEWVANTVASRSGGRITSGEEGDGLVALELPYRVDKLEMDMGTDDLKEGVCKGSCSFLVGTAWTIVRSRIPETYTGCARANSLSCIYFFLSPQVFFLFPLLLSFLIPVTSFCTIACSHCVPRYVMCSVSSSACACCSNMGALWASDIYKWHMLRHR